jgi:DNA modification methylase
MSELTYRIENKDCMDFLSTVEDNSIDYINVDPPYNIGYDGGDGWDTFESEDAYLQWCDTWIRECYRVLKPGAMFTVWGTMKNDLFLRLKLEVLNKIEGFYSQNPILWSYNWGGREKTNFPYKFECTWNYSKGKKPEIGVLQSKRHRYKRCATINNGTHVHHKRGRYIPE